MRYFGHRGTDILKHKTSLSTKRWLLSVTRNKRYVSDKTYWWFSVSHKTYWWFSVSHKTYWWFSKTLILIQFYRNASGSVQSIKNTKRIIIGSWILLLFRSWRKTFLSLTLDPKHIRTPAVNSVSDSFHVKHVSVSRFSELSLPHLSRWTW